VSQKLKIAHDLSLPMEAVTEVLAFLGRRGQGKSYAAQLLAELLHAAGAQFVALDPVGIWWGLRLAADGKAPGIPIPVLGGLHGDVPLEPAAGKLIADLVVDRGISVVLDVSQFEYDTDRVRFAHDFGARFYHRRKEAPAAVHVFLEEAQEFVPQNPASYGGSGRGDRGVNESRMLHVYQRMAKLGRNYGIGLSLISQRPQEVHKKVLNLTELLFAFQLTGPHERKAVEGWIQEKGIDEDIGAELPKLERAAPHAWSPAWLKISEVVHIGEKWTFDASSTPKVGKAAATRALGPIDLEQLRTAMAATIEKAKAEDPKELRRQLAERDREIRQLKAGSVKSPALPASTREKVVEKRIEVPVLEDGQIAKLGTVVERMGDVAERLVTVGGDLRGLAGAITEALHKVRNGKEARRTVSRIGAPPPRALPISPPKIRSETRQSPAGDLPRPHQRILNALAWLAAIGNQSPNKVAVAFIAGYRPGGGAFNNPLGNLRSQGLIDYGSGTVFLTATGLGAARFPDAPLTVADLHRMVLDRLDGPERRILQPLLDAYPDDLGKDQVAEASGYSQGGGAFNNPLGRLRTLGLIDYPRQGRIVALSVLFLEETRR
jgi:hypothetical protein